MSNIGLSTNTFRITGKYLDMLNDIIVETKISSDISAVKREQLIEFLLKVIDTKIVEPQFQLLSTIIERELRISRSNKLESFINSLLKEVKENNIDKALPKIEFIVDALDTENSEALSKIKGD